LKIVTYDLEEFVLETNPEYPIRYEVKRKAINDAVMRFELRLYGIDYKGNVMIYREVKVFTLFDNPKAWFEYINELIDKLEARPGRYLPR